MCLTLKHCKTRYNELRVMPHAWVCSWILHQVVREVSLAGNGVVISNLDFER